MQRGAHYLQRVKANQPALHTQLKALPWTETPMLYTSETCRHGRIERRTITVDTVSAGILFPHARQAIQITHAPRRLDSPQ